MFYGAYITTFRDAIAYKVKTEKDYKKSINYIEDCIKYSSIQEILTKDFKKTKEQAILFFLIKHDKKRTIYYYIFFRNIIKKFYYINNRRGRK